MAKFFCDILRADLLVDGSVAFVAKAYAIAPDEPVEIEGLSDLTLTGSGEALFAYLGKTIELAPVSTPPAARGDSGLVG